MEIEINEGTNPFEIHQHVYEIPDGKLEELNRLFEDERKDLLVTVTNELEVLTGDLGRIEKKADSSRATLDTVEEQLARRFQDIEKKSLVASTVSASQLSELNKRLEKLELSKEVQAVEARVNSLIKDVNFLRNSIKQDEERNIAEKLELNLTNAALLKRIEILEHKALAASRLDELTVRLERLESRGETRWNRFWRRFLLGIE